jgi:two-component system phosphate regulon sensor histidine kinase PhoR
MAADATAKRRLLWHIYPSYVLITLMSLVAVGWYASYSTRQFALKRTAEDLQARAQLIRAQLPSLKQPVDVAAVQGQCRRLGPQSQSRVTVILESGDVIGDSELNPLMMENHSDRPEFVQALGGGVGHSIRKSTSLNIRMMYIAVPVREDSRIVGVVRTSMPIEAVDKAHAELLSQIVLAGLVILAVGAIVGLLVARRISAPIEELRVGVERFAGGDLQSRLRISASSEIEALAEAMNNMAGQLDRRIRDVTDQKKQEEAVLASMVESVLAVDNAQRIIRVNRAAALLFGMAGDAYEGRALPEVIRHPDLHSLVSRTLESDSPIEGEITLYDPVEKTLQVHGTSLEDSAGERIGALFVLNDITRLRRLERVRRDFVANVSHELKTPITTIKGFVETLLGGALENRADAVRFLEIIARHTDRLNAIIDDLLSLSRLDQGTGKEGGITFEPVDLNRVIQRAVDACRAEAEARRVRVVVEDERPTLVTVNPPLLEQAIVNLLNNAIKYSDEGDAVEISARWVNDEMMIRVADRGCGIEPEHLPRIFERFYRTDKARSRDMGGTGLGLAIVKHIAMIHGGRVSVESHVGEGSTFYIVLPRSRRSEPAASKT